VSVVVGVALTGESRTKLFDLVRRGEIASVRNGKRRLLVYSSVVDYCRRKEAEQLGEAVTPALDALPTQLPRS
jgi:hypothetical protein